MRTEPKSAETIGLEALGWLVGHEDLLPVFMGSTGATEQDLRKNAADPAFLGAVLDFLMMDDAWVIGFCEAHDLPGEAVMQARQALPGGAAVNWT